MEKKTETETETESEILTSLPKTEIDPEELIHQNLVRIFNEKFPLLDNLMCSALLKCPPELMNELISKPEMWITPSNTTTLLTDCITIT